MLESLVKPAGRLGVAVVAMILVGCAHGRTIESGDSGHPMTIPEHLRDLPDEMWTGAAGKVVEAPPEDLAVARSYPTASDKGPLSPNGERLTILTAKVKYSPDEEIRVIHVHEATLPGIEVYIAGPKPIHGETINGCPATPVEPSGFDLNFIDYDGPILESPAVDYNYDVTVYRLPRGTHVIQWAAQTEGHAHAQDGLPTGALTSNELKIEVK